MPRFGWARDAWAAASLIAIAAPVAADTLCREVRVAIQPDCFRPTLQSDCNKRKVGAQLDLGPQIAVWIAKEADNAFVDTMMVTALTASRGLGNRPGRWDFRSAPRFPYGRRPNVLPVWAWARGKLYPLVVMQDGKDSSLGFHEAVSSPDPYFCRPMSLPEIDVDAITCPTAVFSSSKGRFDAAAKTPYPPRNDLVAFTERDCDELYSKDGAGCPRSAASFERLNDLDAVSRATPAYGRSYEIRRLIPRDVAPGRYLLYVEVNKEFDQNQFHKYPSPPDPQLPEAGVGTNLGQPSVVFRVPFVLDANAMSASALSSVGYGDWDGKGGALHPIDSSISNAPGSGEGRLAKFPSPWAPESGLEARVHVMTAACEEFGLSDAGTDAVAAGQPEICQVPSVPDSLQVEESTATSARISFLNEGEGGEAIVEYDVRYSEGNRIDAGSFSSGIPAPLVYPGAPGTTATFDLTGLRPSTQYVVAIRATNSCHSASPPATLTFETKPRVFAQLSGCFVATAAFGSPLASELVLLRLLRDRTEIASAVGKAVVDSYYHSSPPLASALTESSPARAATRILLTAIIDLGRVFHSVTQ